MDGSLENVSWSLSCKWLMNEYLVITDGIPDGNNLRTWTGSSLCRISRSLMGVPALLRDFTKLNPQELEQLRILSIVLGKKDGLTSSTSGTVKSQSIVNSCVWVWYGLNRRNFLMGGERAVVESVHCASLFSIQGWFYFLLAHQGKLSEGEKRVCSTVKGGILHLPTAGWGGRPGTELVHSFISSWQGYLWIRHMRDLFRI